DNVDLLRELGGVAFVYNLSKSTIVHSDVKEVALFTLGTLAEANVYCKNSLCRKEIFADIASLLVKEDVPLTQKRVSVYMLFVLVANNKSGQTLAQATGCLDIVLELFRTTFPLSTGGNLRISSQTFQLWASLSSALCGCVNNPQNEEAQRICVAAFPMMKIWLQQISVPCAEIFQPICSFIAMTVANNSCVQESFSASGGLETLTLALVSQASAADRSSLACQLSVIMSKTLSACITDNSSVAAGLAQYGLVSHLFSLLTSSYLDPDDRLSVLLTIGQCTQASAEHQSQLVECGGLPPTITFLTEDKSEEVRKAATFILDTCKKAIPGLKQAENEEPFPNIEDFKSSARELLHRIALLEDRQLKEVEDKQEDPSNLMEDLDLPSQFSALPVLAQQKESIKDIHRLKSTQQESGSGIRPQTATNTTDKEIESEMKKFQDSLGFLREKMKSNRDESCAMCKGGGVQMSSHKQSPERGIESHSVNRKSFKRPLPVWQTKLKEADFPDDLQDLQKKVVDRIPLGERSGSHIRCAHVVVILFPCNSHSLTDIQCNLLLKFPLLCSTSKYLKKKKRQDFSKEEVRYLLSGVKKYGFSWNSILWSYPFQPGRTNVDLAKKYRRLMVM
ncbi:unnamed protein product, partial [Menidia menidia]